MHRCNRCQTLISQTVEKLQLHRYSSTTPSRRASSTSLQIPILHARPIPIANRLHHHHRDFSADSDCPFSVIFFDRRFGRRFRSSSSTAVSSGVLLGRELVNSPPNVLTPGVLAEEASTIASTYSDVFTAKILDTEQFGKGMTFYSGGYNIKTGPGCMIELMKFDMGGSAAVLGAAKALGQIKPLGVEVYYLNHPLYFFLFKTKPKPKRFDLSENWMQAMWFWCCLPKILYW
ncbi:unnamed protein product [Vicia faba]|uniref:Cytosol aminopeptidase domain-containing protein n=1 Tax=Vicia faba TaxID=3906 RepID=A0AAV1B7K3_VICFA|nr:unnamed protein product [Vicia faba]